MQLNIDKRPAVYACLCTLLAITPLVVERPLTTFSRLDNSDLTLNTIRFDISYSRDRKDIK